MTKPFRFGIQLTQPAAGRTWAETAQQLEADGWSSLVMPDHFENHKCDLTKLEKLETTFWTDFDKAFSPRRMNIAIEFTVSAATTWKAEGREEQTIEIAQTELISKTFLKLRIPEIK